MPHRLVPALEPILYAKSRYDESVNNFFSLDGYMENDWRRRYWYQALIILEVVLSVVMFIIGYTTDSAYFRGVGVGLVIAWVAGGLAYFFRMRVATEKA